MSTATRGRRPARLAGLLAGLLTLACAGRAGGGGPGEAGGGVAAGAAARPRAERPASAAAAAAGLSWRLPPDMPAGASPRDQRAFDDFAWRSFVALSWPATADGAPDSTVVIGASGDAPTVWEHYDETGEVFLPGGAAPLPWGQHAPPPPACRNLGAGALPVLSMTSKVSSVVAQFVEPFAGPVIDQDSNFARYAIHVNEPAFDYIVDDTLYRKDVQRRRTTAISFPAGQDGTSNVGAVILKSAWKVLTARDSVRRYHTMVAYVYTPPSTQPPITASCRKQRLGLVGFHITHKTRAYPQWIWATFEQVDNVEVAAGTALHPSFSDPACNCADRVNQMPARPWVPDRPGVPTQVVRETPIDSGTVAVNGRWQAALAAAGPASPWRYYRLVGVQHPRVPSDTLHLGAPYPQFLANTVLETYDQGNYGRASSCMDCHFRATIFGDSASGGAKFSDYSYVFMQATEPKR